MLETLDLSKSLPKAEYQAQLEPLQNELHRLQFRRQGREYSPSDRAARSALSGGARDQQA
jgi:hypothetical protein